MTRHGRRRQEHSQRAGGAFRDYRYAWGDGGDPPVGLADWCCRTKPNTAKWITIFDRKDQEWGRVLMAINIGNFSTVAATLQVHSGSLETLVSLLAAVQVRLGAKILLQSIAPTPAPNPRVAAVHVTAVPRQLTALRQSATTRKGQHHP